MAVIGVDIGGTNFRIGAVNAEGKTIRFEKVPVMTVFHTDNPLRDLANRIKAVADGLSIEAAAIGFPATMNADRTKVLQAPNIPFMEDLPVVEYLEKELGFPVFAEKDVTYALYYDMDKYSIPSSGIVCGIYFGTGIGSAVAVNGTILTGEHGCAGELGHVPLAGCDAVCGCGNKGCLEAVAGGKALAALQKEKYPETPIGEMFALHADEEPLQGFVDTMAIAVVTEVNLFDPSRMLLGGGVLNMKGFPMEYFGERIAARVRKPLPLNDLRILYTEDESDKCVRGAAVYARRRLKRKREWQ